MSALLVGIWELVSYEAVLDDGNVSTIDDVAGTLVYTENGWMSEALHLQPTSGNPVHVFYSGTFVVEGATLFHQPLVHINHDMVGQKLPRGVVFDGTDTFILTAPRAGGESRLTWRRIA